MKFSIRDLLLVTVIVAILTAWWLDHRRKASDLDHYHRLLEVLHMDDDGVFGQQARMRYMPTSQAPAPNRPKQ